MKIRRDRAGELFERTIRSKRGLILLENPSVEPARHSERSEESRVFPDLRPFTSFRVTLKGRFSEESGQLFPVRESAKVA